MTITLNDETTRPTMTPRDTQDDTIHPVALTEDDLIALATDTQMAWHGGLICAGVDLDVETIREMAEELLRYRRQEARSVQIAINGGPRRSAILSEAGRRARPEVGGSR